MSLDIADIDWSACGNPACPSGKVTYPTEGEARHVHRNTLGRGYIYRCPHCALFHHTTSPGSSRRKWRATKHADRRRESQLLA